MERSWDTIIRSSHQRCSVKKVVLRNLAKFTRKHLSQGLFFKKVVGGACNFIKKETLAQVFSYEFCKISKNTFSQNTSGRLLLDYVIMWAGDHSTSKFWSLIIVLFIFIWWQTLWCYYSSIKNKFQSLEKVYYPF